jgi:hypothetical protein
MYQDLLAIGLVHTAPDAAFGVAPGAEPHPTTSRLVITSGTALQDGYAIVWPFNADNRAGMRRGLPA